MKFFCAVSVAILASAALAGTADVAGSMVAQKRLQYGRVLYPPQEKGFDPSQWIAKIESPEMTRGGFGRIEDLLDARSRLYAAAELVRVLSAPDAVAEKLVANGYDALNAMDLASATNACARLEARLREARRGMPYSSFSPFSWVKCFTQWGYMRHPDGCSVSEPNPWLAEWQDGFRMNLAQDERVATANSKKNPAFHETRYLAPMLDVKFERSWVDTRWILPDRTITFSLLTPVIDVDGIETLTLSGLSSEPIRLRYPTASGQMSGVTLVDVPAEEPEVVASAIMDFRASPPSPRGWSRGVQKIDPAAVGRPWLWLRGRDWSLALFPGARPVSAAWEKGVFSLRLERKSWVGVLRLKDNLHEWEQPEVCEFFAGTALAPPVSCRASAEGQKVRWTYSHRIRGNAWGTEPRIVAPVPPLLDYADGRSPGSRVFKYPTKWGLYRFCEGVSAAGELPDLKRRPVMRGVNIGIWQPDDAWEAHAAEGADWARAFFDGDRTLEEHLAQLERRLERFGGRMKLLVDPHGRSYSVTWAKGLVPEEDDSFVAMWDAVSRAGARHADAVAGYDLYNEPGIVAGSEGRWRDLCARAARAIRRNHPGATICHPAVYGDNPNGLFNLVPLPPDCEPQAVTYHFYSPHAFTHQKSQTRNVGGDTCVFYPAWSAPMDWKVKTHFGGTAVDWYDRWTLGAILLPAFEHYAEHRKPLHVGEFGVIGYANRKSTWSAFLWTRDAIELMEANGASWHIWNGGFGLGNRLVREYVHDLWKTGTKGTRP